MRDIRFVRQVDKLGRLVLPSDIRKLLEITDGKDSIELVIDDDGVKIKKYCPSCVFCGSVDNLIAYKNKPVCSDCLNDIKSL